MPNVSIQYRQTSRMNSGVALVVKVEVLQPREGAAEAARERAALRVAVEALVGEVDADVIEDPVHDHVDAAVVALADEALEP